MNAILPLSLLLATPSFAETPEEVRLSLDEFLRMYEQAKNRPADPGAASREATLASAQWDGRINFEDGEPTAAVLTGRLRIEVHSTRGWIRLPVLSAQAAVRSATIDGKPAPLVSDGSWYTLVTDKKGSFELVLDVAAQVATNAGSSGFSFDLAPTGANSLRLAVPTAEELDFAVANARAVTRKTIGADRVVEATLPGVGALSVHWQRELPEAAKPQARVYAEVNTLMGVSDGLLKATTSVDHTILFAGVDRLSYQVPTGITVLDVTGPGVRDWVQSGTRIDVNLSYAAENSTTVKLQLESPIGTGSRTTEVPLVTPLGVERSKGWVGVQAGGNLEIAPGNVQGATTVDVRTLPAKILGVTDQPVLLGYKYLGTEAKIPLSLTAHDEVDVLVTLVDQAEASTMLTAEGRSLTSVRYEVRNNRRQFLRLQLPEGAELWSASVAGRAIQPAKDGEGALLLPLVRSTSAGSALASFGVEVVYVFDGSAPTGRNATFTGTLPLADVPTTWVGWSVYVPTGSKVSKRGFGGSLRHVTWLSRPLGAMEVLVDAPQTVVQQESANRQASTGALDGGAAPVRVRLPTTGEAVFFEKLLALDEQLTASFSYQLPKQK
jgi:hypothetical protein